MTMDWTPAKCGSRDTKTARAQSRRAPASIFLSVMSYHSVFRSGSNSPCFAERMNHGQPSLSMSRRVFWNQSEM